jgi:molybdopterin converting factor small subunit
MAIRVEFYGIVRQRAGVSELRLDLRPSPASLADVLRHVAQRLPELSRELVVNGRLHDSLIANLGGARFVHDPQTIIPDGESLLILSADGGG